jgi:cation transport ATPase
LGDKLASKRMPDQKIERIRKLLAEHNQVGMIGDGVNNAPSDGRRESRHRHSRSRNRH